jgi:hypothetical protein
MSAVPPVPNAPDTLFLHHPTWVSTISRQDAAA